MMKANERRKKNRRTQRRKDSPYSSFSKEEITLINEVKDTELWKEEQKKVPDNLVNDKEFVKRQFSQIIKTAEDMKEKIISSTEKEADCGCGKNIETKESSLATDFVHDVLKTDTQSDCDCKKKKVCHFGLGCGVLLVVILIWYVFIKNKN